MFSVLNFSNEKLDINLHNDFIKIENYKHKQKYQQI